MENCSELFFKKSLHGQAWRHFALFGDAAFISTTLDGVMLFSRIKNSRNTWKCLYYSQNSWRDFFSCNGGKLETSEEYACLLVVSHVLESIWILTNKWFSAQYITACRSVVSDYITCAHDISTSQQTSNQWYTGQQITVSKNLKLEKVSIGHGCPRQMPFRKRVYM